MLVAFFPLQCAPMESAHLLLFFLFIFPTSSFLLCPRERTCTNEREKTKISFTAIWNSGRKRKDGTLPSLVLLATTSESCYSLDKPSPPPLLRFAFLSSRGGKVKGARSVGVSVRRIYMH
ncbi:hypothetical protein J3F84DRAFT_354469 [Trichoderma pleuroticola]